MASKRSITTIAIVLLIAAGVYWLTYQHRVRQTRDLIVTLASDDHKEAMEAMQKLRAHGIDLYPHLITAITSGVSRARWRSAVLLGQLDDQRASEPLIKLLNDPEPAVCAAAAGALGHLGARTAIPQLISVLSDYNKELEPRIAAACTLGSLEAEEAVEELTAALKGPAVPPELAEHFWQLQVAAAEALGAIGTTEAASGLIEAVKPSQQDDERVRQAAAYALGDAGARLQYEEAELTSIIEALLQASNDEVGDVRIAATHSWGLFTAPEGQAEKVAEALRQASADPHYWVRQAAQHSRGQP